MGYYVASKIHSSTLKRLTKYRECLVVLLQKEEQLRRERQETRVLRKQQEREMKERDRGSPFQYPTVENVGFSSLAFCQLNQPHICASFQTLYLLLRKINVLYPSFTMQVAIVLVEMFPLPSSLLSPID